MSYVVEIIRPIGKEEVLALVQADKELSVQASGGDWINISWTRDSYSDSIYYAQSRLTCTSPGSEAWEKLQELATKLNAEVIGEEDKIAPPLVGNQGIIHGRSTWVGWPVIVLVLVAALWWKW